MSDISNAGTGIGEQAAKAARDIRDRASHTAKEVVSGAEAKLRSTAEEQKQVGAQRVSAIAGAIQRTADELEGELPQAARYVRGAAIELQNLSDGFRQRGVNELFNDVQNFARNQPAAFLGASVLAGFLAVRFLKTSGQPASAGASNAEQPSAAENGDENPGTSQPGFIQESNNSNKGGLEDTES